MRLSKSLGTILLAILLILQGLIGLNVNIPQAHYILAILALAAGILILIGK